MTQPRLAILPAALALALMATACAQQTPAPTQPPAKPAAPAASPAAKPAASPAAKPAPKPDERGQQLLKDTIAKAQQEGQLTAAIVSSASKIAPQIGEAFKKRFGLTIELKLDVAGSTAAQAEKASVETQAGSPPSADAMNFEDVQVNRVRGVGGIQPIEDWQLLLREINPLVASGQAAPNLVSPSAFVGQAFLYANRTKSLLYNTDLIKSEADLPKARIDLADPKFNKQFGITIFADEFLSGILVYDKQKWLETVDQIGKNASAVLGNYDGTLQQMLLGEYPLSPSNSYYYFQFRAKDPRTPMGIRFFTDYTLNQTVFHIVRKGTRSPAAATLFALWMTTPEAQAIWQPEIFLTNLTFGPTDLDKQEAQLVKDSGSKVINWFDSPETIRELEWLATDEGRKYAEAFGRALTQRRQ